MTTEALPSAAVSLEEIVSKDPSTALYLPLAERLLARGRVADAVRLCEERRARPGKGVGDHIVLGRCYLADGRLAEAREQFEGALSLDRENVVALKSLAGILSHDGRHAEAADLYRAVCRVDAGDLESQSALHQITSGEYPEVRPPEVVVGQGDLTWQPVRLTREEDHLSELALGLRTLESMDAGTLRPSSSSVSRIAEVPATPTASADTSATSETLIPPTPFLSPEDLTIGPRFPREREADDANAKAATAPSHDPRRMEVVVPAEGVPEGGLHHRLGSLDVGEFKESALERLEDALRPVAVRALGEVESEEVASAELILDAPSLVEGPAEPKSESSPATRSAPTRSAVWGDAPLSSSPPSGAVPPSGPAPAADPAPSSDDVPAAPPAGNRAAFESWIRRLGGKG